ncbi:MAG: right-handed parallel beta-helix repeat-containing protein, partial [Eubacteriales bacterium]|nr:right-handed parallel beta-helix repeat-containing protein [Eubacteriales bacterium]
MRWIGLLCGALLALAAVSSALAESALVDVTALSASDTVGQYSPLTLTATVSHGAGAPAGSVAFYALEDGAASYRLLGTADAALWSGGSASFVYADGFADVGAVSLMARYVPAAAETAFVAGASAAAIVNVRGIRTFAELKSAVESASGSRTLTLDSDFTTSGSISIPAGASVTLIGGHTLTRGTADTLFVSDRGGSLTLSDVILNGASLGGEPFLLFTSSPLTLSQGAILRGVASSGGIVAVSSDIVLEHNAVVSDCTVPGGVIRLTNGSLTLRDNARVLNCSSSGNGGGVALLGTARASLSGTASVAGCTAASQGGGFYVLGSGSDRPALTLADDSSISDCKAEKGGGIYADNASVTLHNRAALRDNSARLMGGGLHLLGSASTLTMDGSSRISGNQTTEDSGAFMGGGGARLDGGAKAFMSGNAAVAGNTAHYDGGGFNLCDSAALQMSESASVSGNTATWGNGGGVNVDRGAQLLLSGFATINQNTAHINGGGVDLDGLVTGAQSAASTTATLSGYASIRDNTCLQSGGGVMVYKFSTLTLQEHAAISGNSAKA